MKFLFLIFIIGLAFVGLAYLILSRQHKGEVKKADYQRLQKLERDVHNLALDHMDVDPMARILWDTIQQNRKEIG